MEDWFGALASELKLDERDLELFLRKRRAKWQRRRDPNYRAAPVCGALNSLSTASLVSAM